jgi:hypothetical protein
MKLASKNAIAAILLMLSSAAPTAAGPLAVAWFFEKTLDWTNWPTRFAGAFVVLVGLALAIFLFRRLSACSMRGFVHLT